MIGRAAALGAAAGGIGVAAMTLGEKIEQATTKRPNSYVPGRTLLALVGRRPGERQKPTAANHLMHWGTGITLGALRGVWAVSGLRGPGWSVAHTGLRLMTDQTFENATGAGAPPSSWPRLERRIDVLHKAVYSLVTGAVADALIRPRPANPAGRVSH